MSTLTLPPGTSVAPLSSDLLARFDDYGIDSTSVAQHRLDLAGRSRTSLFPWRGQFSPELVELLLVEYARASDTVADPFLGSGTTLFEAARRCLPAIGAEVNPAAAIMARAAGFATVPPPERRERLAHLERIAERHFPPSHCQGLFAALLPEDHRCATPMAKLRGLLAETAHDPLLQNAVCAITIRLLEKPEHGPDAFWRAFLDYRATVGQIPYSPYACTALHCDARSLPLPAESVQFVVTSPPYINVFNYHQNHRPAMEFLGWNMLSVARSEFGANRKNRGNRFLTVVQYALDMLQALCEVRRVLSIDGHAILIVGRESTVRGSCFQNGRLVAALAEGCAGLRLALRQERKFTTRFGETIYEDILHFAPILAAPRPRLGFARDLACTILGEAARYASGEAATDIERAIAEVEMVQPSPLFRPSCSRDGDRALC